MNLKQISKVLGKRLTVRMRKHDISDYDENGRRTFISHPKGSRYEALYDDAWIIPQKGLMLSLCGTGTNPYEAKKDLCHQIQGKVVTINSFKGETKEIQLPPHITVG